MNKQLYIVAIESENYQRTSGAWREKLKKRGQYMLIIILFKWFIRNNTLLYIIIALQHIKFTFFEGDRERKEID